MPRNKHREADQIVHARVHDLILASDDLGDVILRGHLYVEYWLNEFFIFTSGKGGKHLADRFSFSQKVDIAEATNILPDPEFLVQLRALNSLRNRFAHELFPKDLATQVRNHPTWTALSPITQSEGESEPSFVLRKLKTDTLAMCAYLIGRINCDENHNVPGWLLSILESERER